MDAKQINFYDVAGDAVKYRAESAALPNRGDALLDFQRRQHARGITKAELVLSIYGWTLRYASGLNGFSIISKVGSFDVNKALDCAIEWVGADPKKSVFVRAYSAQKCFDDTGADILLALEERNGSIGGW